MNPFEYLKKLDELAVWTIDTENIKNGQGKFKNGNPSHTPPARGYPVVLSHLPQKSVCDWCDKEVEGPNVKVYSRPFVTSSIWEGRCKDCKQKRIKSNKGFDNE